MPTNVLIALKQVQANVRVFSILCKGVCVYVVYIIIVVAVGHSNDAVYLYFIYQIYKI
jgi:hypothetical protein